MARRHVGITPLGGMIALCAILLLAPEARSQNQVADYQEEVFTISGTIGLAGVSLQGFPGATPPQTDENGVFSVQVAYGWSGTITPIKLGYEFQPKREDRIPRSRPIWATRTSPPTC